MAIESGKPVWLKSGSPQMVVKFKTIDNLWLCTWFEGHKVLEHAFAEAQLTEEEPED